MPWCAQAARASADELAAVLIRCWCRTAQCRLSPHPVRRHRLTEHATAYFCGHMHTPDMYRRWGGPEYLELEVAVRRRRSVRWTKRPRHSPATYRSGVVRDASLDRISRCAEGSSQPVVPCRLVRMFTGAVPAGRRFRDTDKGAVPHRRSRPRPGGVHRRDAFRVAADCGDEPQGRAVPRADRARGHDGVVVTRPRPDLCPGSRDDGDGGDRRRRSRRAHARAAW